MENTLKLIVSADKAARLDVQKAKERRENLTEELGIRKKEIDKKHKEDAEKAVVKARRNADIALKRASSEIEQKTQNKINELQKIYNENYSKWIDYIVNAVTKG